MKNFKIIDAPKRKLINNFKNAKQKWLKTNAAIWFNKICRINQLTPTYTKNKTQQPTNIVHLVGEINWEHQSRKFTE